MKNYQEAILWVVEMDEPGCLDEAEMALLISVQMLAYLYSKDPKKVSRDVVQNRKGILTNGTR